MRWWGALTAGILLLGCGRVGFEGRGGRDAMTSMDGGSGGPATDSGGAAADSGPVVVDSGASAGDAGGGGGDAGPPDASTGVTCADEDLGSATGSPVATGDTGGAGDDYGTCDGDGSPDVAYAWRAPSTGRYRIDTCGTSFFDSVLVVLDGHCAGERLACNDDSSCGFASRVEVDLVEGQVIVIVVDGFGESGHYELAITPL